MLDEVAATLTPVVITKRAKRVAQFLTYDASDAVRSLSGSILRETGDPYGPGDQVGRGTRCARFLTPTPGSSGSPKTRGCRTRRAAPSSARAAGILWLAGFSIWEVAKKVQENLLVLARPVARRRARHEGPADSRLRAGPHGLVRTGQVPTHRCIQRCGGLIRRHATAIGCPPGRLTSRLTRVMLYTVPAAGCQDSFGRPCWLTGALSLEVCQRYERHTQILEFVRGTELER